MRGVAVPVCGHDSGHKINTVALIFPEAIHMVSHSLIKHL